MQLLLCLLYDLLAGFATKWQTADRFKFIQLSQKLAFSPCRGDSLHRFAWNLAWPRRGTWVRLAVQNFMPIDELVGKRLPKVENFHFLVNSRPATLRPSSTIVRGFYTPNYPALIGVLHLTWFASEVTELLLRNCVGKIMHLIEKWLPPFLMSRRPLSSCKVWEISNYARRL